MFLPSSPCFSKLIHFFGKEFAEAKGAILAGKETTYANKKRGKLQISSCHSVRGLLFTLASGLSCILAHSRGVDNLFHFQSAIREFLYAS